MQRADKRKYHYIYKITRDDGCYYIGAHSTDNLEDGYFGSGKWIRRSVEKYGITPRHSKEILEFFPNRKSLFEAEAKIVNAQILLDSKCMNLCVGGKWGILSLESRKKISESNVKRTGIKHSLERNLKISTSKLGKKFSKEHRESIGKVKNKPCTVDGIKIYPSRGALVAELGTGKKGERSPSFRFIKKI